MMGRFPLFALTGAGLLLVGAASAAPALAASTLEFVDVRSAPSGKAHGNGYRVTGISNYRIGIIGPVRDTMPATTRNPGRLANNSAYAAASAETLPGYLQCVPYARQVSGIQLFGDARSWWSQAAGRYSRGTMPRPGAVMAFQPHGKMVLGHVAAVSRVVDQRHVLLRHANWSPISGRRGQVERDVLAMDVSPANDWSEVRVWYEPVHGLGTTHWPVSGFIYPRKLSTPVHGLAATRWTSDPIGAIIAAFSEK